MNHKKIRGFTLIEVLIYITLVAGILITATSFAWNVINSRTKAFAVQEVEQNGRFIMEKIASMIREANVVSYPAAGGSDDNLQLEMDDSGTLVNTFRLDNEVIQLQEDVGSFIDLSSGNVLVTNLVFSNVSTPDNRTRNVKVNLTLEHINPENRQEWNYVDNFNTTIELRDQ
jgi:type II secretory pathway pseudopilin PulG